MFREVEDQSTPADLQAALPWFERSTGHAQRLAAKSDILKVLRRDLPQPFRRASRTREIAFFSDERPPAGKSLIVAFCGRSHRLMIPWTLFLQNIPARHYDVLILADRNNNHFFNGIEGYAPDLLSLVRRLASDYRFADYKHLFFYGTSTGGLPALRAGMLAGAHRSISVGGQPAWHIHRLKDGSGIQAFDPLCACPWPNRGELLYVFAEGSREDAQAARQLPSALGIMCVPVAGFTEHNLVHAVFRAGRLRALFSNLFTLSPPSQSVPARASNPATAAP